MTRPRNPRSVAAEIAFRTRLEELGATLMEPEWLGSLRPHRVRCREGHESLPRPASLQQGQGICRTCAGQDRDVAEAQFRARLADLGAEMLGPYVNRKTKVHCRCAAGHDCYPNPGHVTAGGGICRTCSGQDPAVCEAKFLARLAELGAVPLYATWRGSGRPHEVRCVSGHACRPRPSDAIQGHGICNACARKCPELAEARFLARLVEEGATSLEDAWGGVDAPHRVQCARGHIGQPRPTHVLSGTGVCNVCAHNGEWDVFYVVTSAAAVKFGITSSDSRPRLRAHARDGFAEVRLLARGLPGSTARDTEDAIRAALALARELPVRGREYFPLHCLGLILDVAASWLAPEVKRGPRTWEQGVLFAA